MREEIETELETMDEEYETDAELTPPNLWDAEVAKLMEEQQEAKEVADAASDFRPTIEALLSPGRVADEMLERSRYLRSRPLQNMKRRELEILSELDTIEAQARTLNTQRQLGAVSDAQVAAEMAELSLAVFAVRGRYADLLHMQGEKVPSRTKPPDPADRKRELEQIDAFLARKKARQS